MFILLNNVVYICMYVLYVCRYVVVGDSAGDIKFFDSELKMINW